MHIQNPPYIDDPIDVARLIQCARDLLEHLTTARSSLVPNPNPNPKLNPNSHPSSTPALESSRSSQPIADPTFGPDLSVQVPAVLNCLYALVTVRTHLMLTISDRGHELSLDERRRLVSQLNELVEVFDLLFGFVLLSGLLMDSPKILH